MEANEEKKRKFTDIYLLSKELERSQVFLSEYKKEVSTAEEKGNMDTEFAKSLAPRMQVTN